MFLQEMATDVVIEVNGRKMRAHKCILRSRCQYFAAILAGGWVESAGNVISLSGYSYGAVQFALCHIYSGAAHPPEGISLMELAALADLLGLEGLKEVAAYSLKTNYCHSFHKPCSGCIDGVTQVFPVALNQGLDDLYRKCLRWSCKHLLKVWPSRSFSQLPSELVARCKQHIIAHMVRPSRQLLVCRRDIDFFVCFLFSFGFRCRPRRRSFRRCSIAISCWRCSRRADGRLTLRIVCVTSSRPGMITLSTISPV